MIANLQEEILKILSDDARTSPERIAKMTGCSMEEASACIGDLEKRGIIKRYKTIIDWDKVNDNQVLAFIDIKVLPARDVGFDAVAERVYRYPEVRSVWLVSGGSDLRVVVEGQNIRELGRFVAEKLATIDGVTETNTHFVLRRYKEDHDIFVDQEEDNRLLVTP